MNRSSPVMSKSKVSLSSASNSKYGLIFRINQGSLLFYCFCAKRKTIITTNYSFHISNCWRWSSILWHAQGYKRRGCMLTQPIGPSELSMVANKNCWVVSMKVFSPFQAGAIFPPAPYNKSVRTTMK